MFQLQAAALSRGLASLSEVCVAVVRILCVIIIPLRLSQISSFTLQQPQCFTSLANISLPCSSVPASVPQPQVQIQFYSLFLFLPSFLCPTECCVILYILFRWSGSQLVFCKIFCVWRCIPDISVERDVLHLYLLFHHTGSQCMV